MRIRWKFLIVLLCISLVPILVLRWMGRHSMRELSDDLAARTREVLIQRTSQELKSLVEEHATILMRERDLVEMALQVQVLELEKQFGGGAIQRTSDPAVNIGDSGADRVEFRPSTKHVKRMGMTGPRPLSVSYRDQTYRIPSGIGRHNAYQLGVAVGDVSGHGIQAALLMATVRAFLKSRVRQPGSIADVIADINRLVADDTSETGQFMTLFYKDYLRGRCFSSVQMVSGRLEMNRERCSARSGLSPH